eukprot:CAMPEP_0201573614 /NCGR_PEP_ID=MMETSP0190_2-20130828/17573_1 /ASSEMBLY_ACC=CAM_ASM_000263 /TAXON_ID=37353 /ORGANISM="Rosalina sp." /LENGTH=218 /DNA_ID=CAMNT_0048000799 /DNA_START=79 /DNA_END=735 /DNA_ORIENTATION=-
MSRRPKKKVLVKIIIIGESGVGKTAILHQYVMDKFIQEHKATIGADFLTKEINVDDKIVTLQIWDTAGQERFQSLGNAFYRGADACILVYDITDENSFKEIDQWRSKFVNQANIDNPRNYPFLLLGNKTDLDEKRKVSHNQGDNYAKDNGMEFAETSALRGTNIEKSFMNIAEFASESDTVPFFTEDLVERIQIENDGGGGGNRYNQPPQGGCACQLL